MSEFPQIFRVRQELPRPTVKDVALETRQQLESLTLEAKVLSRAKRRHHRRQPRHRQHRPGAQRNRSARAAPGR